MKEKKHKINKGNLWLFIAAIVFFLSSVIYNIQSVNTDRIAKDIGRKIEDRMRVLDSYVQAFSEVPESDRLESNHFPEDMVIYKYVDDTLDAWSNHFPVLNDDISSKVVYERITTLADRVRSPLAKVNDTVQYMNLGPKWYITKTYKGKPGELIIAGIEIKNDLIENQKAHKNGINHRLRLSQQYSITSLDEAAGSVVKVNDKPVFKVVFESKQAQLIKSNSILKWIAVILLFISCIWFLKNNRSPRTWFLVVLITSTLIAILYIWGIQLQASSLFFSPGIYADGPILFSFGALFLINLWFFNLILCGYIMQKLVINKIRRSSKPQLWFKLYFILISIILVITLFFINWGFRSIIQNSNISLSLYRWNENTGFSVLVYIEYIALLSAVMMELISLRAPFKAITGKSFNPSSKISIIILAAIATIYFALTVINLGFKKEQDRAIIWGNKLSLNRDLELEISLKHLEIYMLQDSVMASLCINSNEEHVENRIIEYYLNKESHKYNINVNIVSEKDVIGQNSIKKIREQGEKISDDSHIYFMDNGKGFIGYYGIFSYNIPGQVLHLVINLESRDSKGDRGYYSLLRRYSSNLNQNIPRYYSYAKYIDGKLCTFKGRYPYPTTLASSDLDYLGEKNFTHTRKNKHTHFFNRTSPNEIIIISRHSGNFISFFTSISYLFLVGWFVLHLFFGRKKIKKTFKKNYYRSRINTILFMTSVFILVGITAVSLIFVIQRNEVNLQSIMSSKISMLQSHVETQVKDAESYTDLENINFLYAIEEIGNITKSDLTLFTPTGKVFLSTTPEIFERMIMGSRINAQAFHNIVDLHHRFYVHDEKFEGKYYYSMYAPISNKNGKMVAILSAPYTEENFNFKIETVLHTALVINLFIILLLLSMFFSTHEVDEMFKPLLEMGKKMNKADLDNLEYIEYNRNDEISTIVDEYNRMVKAIQESKVILAKAERNKAWSEMARQIAHEIKNPLTPIQLELQMLMRKKKNNDPVWMDRFDKACDVILEHIKILTDTASLFSNVAKIYQDEPQLIDLDALIKEHITIYENRENIKVSYMGNADSMVMAPRSQIIRVFVNLMTNSVQAIENYQSELTASGKEAICGEIIVCLRRSTKDGYYDLVVEDNGPGVKDKDMEKLFRPNFTTKSSGTGLGLAICRNIIEECKGEINYKKSFALKGASFTVTLPRYNA